jgi:protein involved in polysaccharide export with SLBB domain
MSTSKCAAFALVAWTAATGTGQAAVFADFPLNPTVAPSKAVATNTLAAISTNSSPASLAGYIPDDKYKLRAGDKISFQILEDKLIDDKDVPKSLVVADSGELDLPYVGRVAATDRTCKQLGDEIKTQLEKEFYYRATVILALDQANKYLGRIYVLGQVRTQGPLEMAINENLTAGRAILRAGGFADFANKKTVQVVRPPGPDGSGGQTFKLNMVEILEEGKTEKDVLLQPDDFIMVRSRLLNF